MKINSIDGATAFQAKKPKYGIKVAGELKGKVAEAFKKAEPDASFLARANETNVTIAQNNDGVLINSGVITSTLNSKAENFNDKSLLYKIKDTIHASIVARQSGLQSGLESLKI